jgi:hypothetical protein
MCEAERRENEAFHEGGNVIGMTLVVEENDSTLNQKILEKKRVNFCGASSTNAFNSSGKCVVVRLVRLGSSYLIAHVLHSQPPSLPANGSVIGPAVMNNTRCDRLPPPSDTLGGKWREEGCCCC